LDVLQLTLPIFLSCHPSPQANIVILRRQPTLSSFAAGGGSAFVFVSPVVILTLSITKGKDPAFAFAVAFAPPVVSREESAVALAICLCYLPFASEIGPGFSPGITGRQNLGL
jgi:hypothetical protein